MAHKKSIWRKDLKYEINEFANMCGFFNGETAVNNGYGCNHPKQEETELQYIDKPDLRIETERFNQKIILALLRRKFGSYQNIMIALKTKEGSDYLLKINNELRFDPSVLNTLNLKKQGKCYAFSCPLGQEVNENDIVQPYETVYERSSLLLS